MQEKTVRYVKTVISLLVFIYCMNIAMHPTAWHFIDNVDLVFHEAGHWVFMFFGDFICVAGGTLMQLLIPFVVFLHLFTTGQRYSAYLVLYWLGQSFVNVSVYARDAQDMVLPLLGGDGTGHDWHWLLSHLGVLEYTSLIAGSIFTVGCFLFLAAVYFSLFEVWERGDK